MNPKHWLVRRKHFGFKQRPKRPESSEEKKQAKMATLYIILCTIR